MQIRTLILKELGNSTKAKEDIDFFKTLFKVYTWCFISLEDDDFKKIPYFKSLESHKKNMRYCNFNIISSDNLRKQIKNVNTEKHAIIINNEVLNQINKKDAEVYNVVDEMIIVIGYVLANNPFFKDRDIPPPYLIDNAAKVGQAGYFKQEFTREVI